METRDVRFQFAYYNGSNWVDRKHVVVKNYPKAKELPKKEDDAMVKKVAKSAGIDLTNRHSTHAYDYKPYSYGWDFSYAQGYQGAKLPKTKTIIIDYKNL